MNITIVGSGNVGRALGENWRQRGHGVTYAAREPAGAKAAELKKAGFTVLPIGEAAKDADVIVLATPWDAVPATIKSLGSLADKIVIDTTDPLNRDRQLSIGFNEAASHRVVDMRECPILSPSLFALVDPLRHLLAELLPDRREARVEVTLADRSPAVGISLADLDIPRDATIVAVVRRERLIVPRGDTVLEPGDEVLSARAVAQPLGDRDEQRVARLVPELVVDRLELVEVEIEQGREAP